VGFVVQLRTCIAGVCAAGVEGQSGEYRCGSARIHQEINGLNWLAVLGAVV